MILVIDNYDSFTFNLVQYLGELGESVEVVRNDAITIERIRALGPERIVMSPGPGRPEQAGIIVDAIRTLAGTVPILGVCLGHQAIGAAFGGDVVLSPQLMHGKTSMIHHDGRTIFRGLPEPVPGDPVPFARGRPREPAGLPRSVRPNRGRHHHGVAAPRVSGRRRAVPPGVDPDGFRPGAPGQLCAHEVVHDYTGLQSARRPGRDRPGGHRSYETSGARRGFGEVACSRHRRCARSGPGTEVA